MEIPSGNRETAQFSPGASQGSKMWEEDLDSLNGGGLYPHLEMGYTGPLGTPGLKLQNPEAPFEYGRSGN